jgi:transglutaminase-like putative cysteine protease
MEEYGGVTTRRVQVGCEFVQLAAADTPAVMQIRPTADEPVRLLSERWTTEPELATHGYADLYGNPCLRLVLPAGRSRFTYEALVEVPDATEDVDPDAPQLAPDQMPDDVLIYTLPSRYCLPEMLGHEAERRFGGIPPGYGRVQAICDFVWGHVQFAYGSSTSTTTSHDVHLSGFGVCRDFTHLAIAFCRALDVPARYVFGYLPQIDVTPLADPMDFAAWMEVWLGDRWWTFDPRNNTQRKGRILIGRGRDASDVAMVTAFGQLELESMVVVAHEVGSPTPL